MSSGAFIVANDNIFNKSILEEDALYFSHSDDVAAILTETIEDKREHFVANNIQKIKTLYTWDKIINDYEKLFIKLAK